MVNNSEDLRTLLQQYISGVYSRALDQTRSADTAKEVTRRVMALLKRTYETGMSVNDSLVNRLTDDCCHEMLYYAAQRTSFKNGTIADMPDFDTALSSISNNDVAAAKRRAAEDAASKRAAEKALLAKEQAEKAVAKAQAEAAAQTAEAIVQQAAPAAPVREEPAPRKQKGPVELFDDDIDDPDEYDEPDDEPNDDEPEEKPRAHALPALLLGLLAVVLLALVFCLAMMLIARGVLPGANSPFVTNFTTWFNSSFFILF